MATEYESERTATREQVAATLREMADGVATGSLLVGEGEEATTVGIPDAVTMEIELETEDGERSVEFELEWPAEGSEEDDASESHPSDRSSVDAGAAEDDTEEPSDETTALPVGSPQPSRSLAHFELFRDQGEEWRWRLVHRNGNVIATSGEGYTRKHNAEKGLRSVVRNAPDADVVDDASE